MRERDPIRKGFVRTGERLVHYRMSGAGPPLVLLHDSPRSSVLHIPLIKALRGDFTVIALDTPGYGRSDPLPKDPRPEIADFGDALAQALDALQLDQPTVYAFHTSSKIALDCAARHPGLIGSMVIDGLSIPAEPASDDFIERYMKPFEVSDDGAYIAEQWTKARDIHRFFPWFERCASARMAMSMPGPEALHAYALDLFMAGDDFPSAYGAAMRFMALPSVKALATPTVFMARATDVLYPFLDILEPHLPEICRIERLSGDEAEWQESLVRCFRDAQNGQRNYALTPASAKPSPRGYQYHDHGDLLVERHGSPGAFTPLIVLHDVPGCAVDIEPLALQFAPERLIIAPELPGCGFSDALLVEPSAAAYADVLAEMARRENLGRFDLVASLLSTPLAVALAQRHPELVRRIVLDGAIVLTADQRREFTEKYCPPVELSRDGTHFQSMWHQPRDRELAWPWFDTSKDAIRKISPNLDGHALNERLIAIMQQPSTYGDACKAAIAFEMTRGLAELGAPILFFTDDDPAYASAPRAIEFARLPTIEQRPQDTGARARAISEFLDG